MFNNYSCFGKQSGLYYQTKFTTEEKQIYPSFSFAIDPYLADNFYIFTNC